MVKYVINKYGIKKLQLIEDLDNPIEELETSGIIRTIDYLNSVNYLVDINSIFDVNHRILT